jgi:serine/threonine protein kinase/tetratricopeptide (TPR) repeat protein
MSSQHQRAKDLFLEALDRAPAERGAFLAEACQDDPQLRAEVESLLAFHEDEQDHITTTGGADGEEPGAWFSPGSIFAGRYRMVTRLGRGGMGDVWQAEDMVLDTAVALKLILAPTPERAEQIRREARLSRQITHPNVCRVFDVGEADGYAFFTMELIEGEDLGALLRRVGRLPSEKVADIGRQVCAGLAAAHARGVLHRDLKPANLLIDNDGVVRISDFGIAITRDVVASHLHTGTPGYMAPEQRGRGDDALSERTDIYAVGLVLYELLVGHHALTSVGPGGMPPPPSTQVHNVDPRLDRIIMQALSPDPAKRPVSVVDVASALPEHGHRPKTTPPSRDVYGAADGGGRKTRWIAAAAVAVVAAVAVSASLFLNKPAADTLTSRDTVVIADFENSTEPVFDGALRVALAVALEQSPFLKVFPDERARETLRLMQRSPDERITRAIARDIARREQLKGVIAGSILSLGRNYVIGLEAVNAETGDVMAREQAEAANKEGVLTALGTATSRLREKLGESLASVQRFDAPLPRATTPSLEALHAYSMALYEGREVPRAEAIPHLKRAIELDPTFAMAHAQLSGVYANTGQSALAPEHSRRAFELRDRVSERERFFISWRYYRDATQDWEKALDLTRSWTATYPREGVAFNSLGAMLIRFGQFEQAVEPLRNSIRLDPRFTPAYSNLSAVLLALNRPDEARGILKEAADRNLAFIGARRLSYLIAFEQGDVATMSKELEASINESSAAFGWQAHASAATGRPKAADEQFTRGIEAALQSRIKEVASQLTVEDGEVHALFGECAEARRQALRGLELNRDNTTLERASRSLALCGAADETTRLTDELQQRFPDATLTIRAAVPIARAALALARNDASAAVQLLEPVARYNRAPSLEFWPSYLRGQAHLTLKHGQAAAAEFQNIADRRREVPAATILPLAYLGLARAEALINDKERAVAAYEKLFELWKDAEPDLKLLQTARAEYSRLRQN